MFSVEKGTEQGRDHQRCRADGGDHCYRSRAGCEREESGADERRPGAERNGEEGATINAGQRYADYDPSQENQEPRADADLLDFDQKDDENLQDIFMELVAELFEIPEAKRKAKEDFLKSRKIVPKPTATTKAA
jgi:hypothetical protein